MPPDPDDPAVVLLYPLRFRDRLSGKWVRARYKATADEIRRQYPVAMVVTWVKANYRLAYWCGEVRRIHRATAPAFLIDIVLTGDPLRSVTNVGRQCAESGVYRRLVVTAQ